MRKKHQQSRTAAATAPVALAAVCQHIVDHALPASTIDAPRTNLGETAVLIYVDQADLDTWTSTLAVVDDTEHSPSPISPHFERVIVKGRITSPVGLVPVTIRAYQQSVVRRALKAVRS